MAEQGDHVQPSSPRIRIILSAGFAGACFLLMLFAWRLLSGSVGLYGPNGQGQPFQCDLLMSSGNDDEIWAMVLVLLVIPMTIRVFRYSKYASWAELLLYVFIVNIYLGLTQRLGGCGDILYTLSLNLNFDLTMMAVWFLVGFVVLTFSCIQGRRSARLAR
ncbi:hypothetical protein KX729_08860 [Rhizobium sp. XQZ8]|uniref:hypothetical protein n=1 Tax=Rhizobium populisoli TaxID=2859785 RepID=UPI001CA48C3D|nr:hypothetical protein [Rhizobium populisoli]MBW6421549.1 hypothetical protein [Rhizobium populisoli]